MGVKRIKPNIESDRFEESRTFYVDIFGLEEHEGLDWILFFGTDDRALRLSVMKLDIKAGIHPDVSIESTTSTPVTTGQSRQEQKSSTPH